MGHRHSAQTLMGLMKTGVVCAVRSAIPMLELGAYPASNWGAEMRVLVSLLMLLVAPAAYADKRVALVIGNSAYQHAPSLPNPKNDAIDLTAALHKHGFQVIEGLDLDKAMFDRKVRDFAVALKGSEVGVFFYAGHGFEVARQNYLVPIDAKAEEAEALDFEMVRLDVVHRIMERQTSTNILFLDACRDNPFARNLARALGTRSAEVGRGLAAVESGVGTLISFSTQPGNVALDGKGRNSPFTGALVRHISTASDDLGAILIAVRNDVMKSTQSKQVPWEHSALTGRFYFSPPPSIVVPPPPSSATPPPAISEAERAWNAAKDTKSVPALQAFINRFGDTYYGDLAKVRLQELEQAEAAKKKAEVDLRAKAEPADRSPAIKAKPATASCGAVTAGARLFATEPPRGVGALGVNEKAFVNDGTCPSGHIKEIVGGDGKIGLGRKVRCVRC
jgi:uncharacterized caspase-like protein